MTEPDLDHHRSGDAVTEELRADVVAGLTAEQKWLPPKWFYDAEGSELFEKITQLPEYYPTRSEREVLAAHAGDVAELTGAHTLVELGSGSSEKTRLLLDALTRHGTLATFVPLDVSESALADAARSISADYPGLEVRGSSATSPSTSICSPVTGRGWLPSSAARSATSCPPSARRSSGRCGRSSTRGSGCCSARTW